MLLVGSLALSAAVHLERKINDIDLWCLDFADIPESITQHKLIKSTDRSRIYLTTDKVAIDVIKITDPTDIEIYKRTTNAETEFNILTCVGAFPVPMLYDQMIITKASAECYDRVKYKSDFRLLQERYPTMVVDDMDLYKRRLEETKNRLKGSSQNKYEFFHKYDLPEHIEHDLLHVWVADLMGLDRPTYEYFIEDDTTPSKEFFDKLEHERQVSRFVEESLVLSWERWLIPKMVEYGTRCRPLLARYFNIDNVNCPPRQLLNHVCLKGLRDEKPFMREFGTMHFTEIERKYLETLQKLKEVGLPQQMLNKVKEIRDVR